MDFVIIGCPFSKTFVCHLGTDDVEATVRELRVRFVLPTVVNRKSNCVGQSSPVELLDQIGGPSVLSLLATGR